MDIEAKPATKMGMYFPAEFIEEFRAGCRKRGYKQSALIRIAVTEVYLEAWRKEDAEERAA